MRKTVTSVLHPVTCFNWSLGFLSNSSTIWRQGGWCAWHTNWHLSLNNSLRPFPVTHALLSGGFGGGVRVLIIGENQEWDGKPAPGHWKMDDSCPPPPFFYFYLRAWFTVLLLSLSGSASHLIAFSNTHRWSSAGANRNHASLPTSNLVVIMESFMTKATFTHVEIF